MFFNINPTNKYLIAIDDGIALLCDSKDDALALWRKVESIEESPFGAMQFMTPGQIDRDIYGNIATESILVGRHIANHDYIDIHAARRDRNWDRHLWDILTSKPVAERLREAKFDMMSELFGEPARDWRQNRVSLCNTKPRLP